MKRSSLTLLILVSALIWVMRAAPVVFADEVKTADRDKDGRIDSWRWYDKKNALVRSALDTNGDAKPDRFIFNVQGGTVVLKEIDRNHDGKIDERSLNERYLDKKLHYFRYRSIWKESDADYDGIVDEFRKHPSVQVPDSTGRSIQNYATVERSTPTAGGKTRFFGSNQVLEHRANLENSLGPHTDPEKETK